MAMVKSNSSTSTEQKQSSKMSMSVSEKDPKYLLFLKNIHIQEHSLTAKIILNY